MQRSPFFILIVSALAALSMLLGGAFLRIENASADPCEGIYLSVDETRTDCTANDVGMYPVYIWIWVKPDSLGVICAEFRLSYPANVIQSEVTKNTPIISVDMGDLASGYSVCFFTCQYDWVWIARQLVYVMDPSPGSIRVDPHPIRDSVLVSDCTGGYPTHGVRGGEVWLNAEPGPPCAPLDLEISSGAVSVSPDTVELGQDVSLSSWTVLNAGCWETLAFSNGYYLSTDTIITATDIRLDTTTTVTGLGPGDETVFPAANLTIPADRMAGDYYIGVLADRLDAVDETDESDNYVSTPITLTGYCTARGSCQGYISRVQVGDIDNSSGCVGYSDYTSQSTEMMIGSSYDMIVDVVWIGFEGCVVIWTDWNQDFAATAEETTRVLYVPDGHLETTISPPGDALPGDTRMRVRMNNSHACSPLCKALIGGEVEDYTITIFDPAGVSLGDISEQSSLGMGHPNPFGPSTTISFSMESGKRVRAAVYDLTGRHIRTLADRHYSPGSYSLSWDGKDRHGRDVAPGVYIVRMEAEDRVEATKVTLLR